MANSSIRFYFFDPKTGEEIQPPCSSVYEGTGAYIGKVKGLDVREMIYVGKTGTPVTIADFEGRESVKVKLWVPEGKSEWFYLSSKEVLAKYGLDKPVFKTLDRPAFKPYRYTKRGRLMSKEERESVMAGYYVY